jgi:membrane-associated phospholipid phosphatase
MSLPADLKRASCRTIRLAWQWLRRHWRGFASLQLLLLVLIWTFIHPHDREWLASVHNTTFGWPDRTVENLAGWLSKWGDFPGFNLALGVGLWLLGLVSHRRHWQRLALVTLLAAALAGTATVLLRSALGRTRPQASVVDGFYGPHRSTNFQSCPSGHTTTAFTAGLSLLVAAPEVGVPATLVAASIGWSRMFLKRHYPADVAMGIWMALWFAVPFGFSARERSAAPDDQKEQAKSGGQQ